MTKEQDQSSAQRLPPSTHLWRYIDTDVAFIGTMCVGAALTLPVIYAERFNEILWGVSILAFAGFPLLTGIMRRQPSLSANVIAGMLLLACPVVYVLTDPMPVRFELTRDAFFLAAASSLAFVSTGWTTKFVRTRQWARAFVAVVLNVVAVGSIAIMISVFIYLE